MPDTVPSYLEFSFRSVVAKKKGFERGRRGTNRKLVPLVKPMTTSILMCRAVDG